MGRKSTERNIQLTVDNIVTAAWELVTEQGLDGLSTRALATRLDVQSPALYWHVKNKSELLSLMFERVLQQSFSFDERGLDWKEWTRQLCHQQHSVMLAHRDSGRIASIAVPSRRIQSEILPRMYKPFISAGFDEEEAFAAAGLMITFILGWVIYEQRPDTLQFLRSAVDVKSAFSQGVEIFLEGVEQKLASKRSTARQI